MIIGHYASTLLPHSRDRRAPLALYLFVAIMQDLLWLLFAALGLEPTAPASVLDASFAGLRVEMSYSHDLAPALGWAAFAAVLGFLVTRSQRTALYCAALSIGHELLDLLSGFHHHVAGPTTAAVGLNLYGTAPYLAILIEAVFGAAMVFAYARSEARRGRALRVNQRTVLYAVFVLGALATLPVAERSLNEWLAFSAPSATGIPRSAPADRGTRRRAGTAWGGRGPYTGRAHSPGSPGSRLLLPRPRCKPAGARCVSSA
jgi:hypothetical protein